MFLRYRSALSVVVFLCGQSWLSLQDCACISITQGRVPVQYKLPCVGPSSFSVDQKWLKTFQATDLSTCDGGCSWRDCKLKCSQEVSFQFSQPMKQAVICVMNLAVWLDVFLLWLCHQKKHAFFCDTGLHFSLEDRRTSATQPKKIVQNQNIAGKNWREFPPWGDAPYQSWKIKICNNVDQQLCTVFFL